LSQARSYSSPARDLPYAGSAPTLACGVTQIDMQIPANAPSGAYSINLQVQMSGSTASGNSVSTIAVR